MQVVVDSLLTSYQISGRGKVIVLLHGWGDTQATFRSLRTYLERTYTVLSLDLPGFGGTEPPRSAWGLSEYATFVAHFLKKIEVKKTHALIGHSNGGGIALRGLGNGTLRATKLVLLASAGIRGEYQGRSKVLRLSVKAGKMLLGPLPVRLKRSIRKRAYNAIGSDMFVAEHLQETFKRIVNDDVRADAPNIAIPVLLIYGEGDTATPARYGALLAELLPHARYVTLPGVGHFIHHEANAEVNRLTKEFLQ